MSRVFTPYQLDKDTEHLLNQLVVYLCVCGGGVGGRRNTLLNPFKSNQLKINLVSYLALISEVSKN